MRTPKGYVGLYVTSDKIEAVLPASIDGSIEETYTYPLPPGLITDEGGVESSDDLGAALKEAWKALGLRTKRVVLILNSRQAIVRLVRLPHLPLNQLNHAILSEAEQFALFRNDAPMVDYFVASQEGDFIQVCYGAAAETLLKPYEAAIKTAGLRLAGVDLVQMAGQRGMAYYHPPDDAPWIGVLLIPQRLIVTAWIEGKLAAVRELVLPERDNISMELVALNYLPDAVRSVAGVSLGEEPRLVIGAQRPEDARELASHAEAHIKLPICIAEPAELDPDLDLPSCVALGAGLWGRSDTLPSFNLVKGKAPAVELPSLSFKIPLDVVKDRAQQVAMPALVGVTGLALLGGAGWLWSQNAAGKVQDLKGKIAAARTESLSLETELKKSEAPPQVEVLRQWIPHHAETRFAADLVSKLRGIVPADTWIGTVSYVSGREVRLQGAALSQTSCLYFADQLGAIDAVAQVRILRLEKQGETYTFELQAQLGQKYRTDVLP
ncbi:MAG TPA: pilus assembly protein PilM [Pantanalinema sp.]